MHAMFHYTMVSLVHLMKSSYCETCHVTSTYIVKIVIHSSFIKRHFSQFLKTGYGLHLQNSINLTFLPNPVLIQKLQHFQLWKSSNSRYLQPTFKPIPAFNITMESLIEFHIPSELRIQDLDMYGLLIPSIHFLILYELYNSYIP